MLTPFIIDRIKKIEEEKRRVKPQSITLELPKPMPAREPEEDEEESDRGVTVIDLL